MAKNLIIVESPAKSKTIYGWENGNSQPNADTLMTLCGYYHIENILETFGYCPAPSKDPDAASILTKEVFRLLELEYNDI